MAETQKLQLSVVQTIDFVRDYEKTLPLDKKIVILKGDVNNDILIGFRKGIKIKIIYHIWVKLD